MKKISIYLFSVYLFWAVAEAIKGNMSEFEGKPKKDVISFALKLPEEL